jgi:hypothetical protein
MSGAFLSLWNDYPAAMAEEYEAWHTFEHVPERLTTPGMLSARRYVSCNNPQSYFTYYEMQDMRTIEHPAYLDLVRNPTPWSLKMRPYFSNVLRIPGETAACCGYGIGGAALVQAYSVARDTAAQALPDVKRALQQMITEARILGFRIAVAEPNQVYEVFTQEQTTDPDAVNVVLLLEGGSSKALCASHDALTAQLTGQLSPRACLRSDIFDLLISYRGDEFHAARNRRDAAK